MADSRHPTRILIIGRQGQVGWELRRTLAPLGHVAAVDFPDIDLTQPDSIRRWVDETRPDVIVNAAAYTAVDKAETDESRTHQINAIAPGILAEAARQRNAWIVHYSTDYVFDGRKSSPYTEQDSPSPLGVYGRTKLEGDQAVIGVGGRFLIFRLCWVYGARGHNFLLTIQRLARERETLRVVNDQVGAPTWSRLIAEATAQALAKVRQEADPARYAGVYNLSCAGSTSWHGFAQAIVDRLPAAQRKCQAVQPISTAEYPTLARRPAYSVLDGDALAQVFGLHMPDWHQTLDMVLET